MNSDLSTGDDAGKVVAWDLPTRMFHWLLVVLVAMSWVSRWWGDANLVWHKWNGYAILILVVWRLLWGFVGSSTSRFASFIHWPWTVARYAIDFILRRPRPFLGHNPLGGVVVFVMLGLVGGQAVLGLFSYDDHDALVGGPLSGAAATSLWQWISQTYEGIVGSAIAWADEEGYLVATRLHILAFDAILIVVALHVLANVLYLVWKGENLVHAMITGHKARRAYEDEPHARVAGLGRAFICLVVAVALVYGGITAAGGKIF